MKNEQQDIKPGERVVFVRDDDGIPADTLATFTGNPNRATLPYVEVRLYNGCYFNAHIEAIRVLRKPALDLSNLI